MIIDIFCLILKDVKVLVVGIVNVDFIVYGCVKVFCEFGVDLVIIYVNEKIRIYVEFFVYEFEVFIFMLFDVLQQGDFDVVFVRIG